MSVPLLSRSVDGGIQKLGKAHSESLEKIIPEALKNFSENPGKASLKDLERLLLEHGKASLRCYKKFQSDY